MLSIPSLSLDDIRAEREAALREQADRTAKYEKDKTSLDADFQALATLLADIEAAERLMLRREQPPRPTANGHDERSKPGAGDDETADHEANDESENDEAEEPESECITARPETHREMVLEAVRGLRAANHQSQRFHIDQFIRREFGIKIPLTSISTYLQRLRAEGLVENPGVGLDWYPVGGSTR